MTKVVDAVKGAVNGAVKAVVSYLVLILLSYLLILFRRRVTMMTALIHLQPVMMTRKPLILAIPMSLMPRPNLRSLTSARLMMRLRLLLRRPRSRLRLLPMVLRTYSLVT